jgi:hypothetical protein
VIGTEIEGADCFTQSRSGKGDPYIDKDGDETRHCIPVRGVAYEPSLILWNNEVSALHIDKVALGERNLDFR